MNTRFFGIKTAGMVILAATCVNPATANAQGFKVDVKKCGVSKGTIAVKDVHASAWSILGVDNPTEFLKSAFAQSRCFKVVNSPSSAKYLIVAGPLTKDEFEAGPEQFFGDPSIGNSGGVADANGPKGDRLSSVLDGGLKGLIGGSKMNYAFVDITDKSDGILARGFGRSNATKLDYSHWSFNQASVQSFNRSKKSRRAGGAMFNAFHEAKKTVLTGNFGTSKPIYAKSGSAAASGKASGRLTVGELFEERRKNGERFFNKYAATKGGKYVTLSGFVAKSNARGKWVQVGSRKRPSTNPFDNISCENVVGAGRLLNLDVGDPITVRGTLKILTKYKEFPGTFGLGDPMAIRRCTIAN